MTQDGKTAIQSFDVPNVQAIFVGAADFFRMDLGFELGVNDKEPPSISAGGQGWKYMNVSAEFGNQL